MANFKIPKEYPFWMEATVKLTGLVLLFVILSYGRFILMPLALSALLAMLLEPLCKLLEKLKIGRIAAILLSMVFVFLVLAGIFSLLSIQLIQFTGQIPQAGAKLQTISRELLRFFQQHFHISPEQQIDFVQQNLQKVINQSGQYMSTILGTTTSIFSTLALLPFFIFFMLHYKDRYRNFLHWVWKGNSSTSVELVVSNIQAVTKNYILGMLMVITILATFNALGLWIIGMDHVLFFAILASIWAVIPYIGIIIGSSPAILYALLFSDSLWMPVGVAAVFLGVQFLEGNFITPNIVGSRVSINPFMALIALIIGEEVWGIVGMIIFVPFVGILKCIFDEVDGLRAYGYLLGNSSEYKGAEKK